MHARSEFRASITDIIEQAHNLVTQDEPKNAAAAGFIDWLGHFGDIPIVELSEQTERCPKFFGDALKLLVCEVPMQTFV